MRDLEKPPRLPKSKASLDYIQVLLQVAYHLNELIQEIESYNRFAKQIGYVPIPTERLEKAKAARDASNEYSGCNKP